MHRFVLVGTCKAAKLAVILDALGIEHRMHPDYPDTLIEARMPLEKLQALRSAVDQIVGAVHA